MDSDRDVRDDLVVGVGRTRVVVVGACVAASVLVGVAAGAGAAGGPQGAADDLRRESAVPAIVRVDARSGHVQKVLGRFPSSGSAAEQRARGFLQRHAEQFGLEPGLGGIRRVGETVDAGGSVVRFRQFRDGVPVLDGSLVVGVDPRGDVIYVSNRHVDDLVVPSQPRVSEAQAVAIALNAVGAPASALGSRRLVIASGGKGSAGQFLAWEVEVTSSTPRADWKVYVDSVNGRVVRRDDVLRRAGAACVPADPASDSGAALLFAENPVDFYDNPSLRDGDNVDGALVGCKLNNLTSATELTGTYVTTAPSPSPRATPPYDSLPSENERAVNEATAYYHVNRSKEYLTGLGFPGVMSFQLPVNASDTSAPNNAYYSPNTKSIGMGVGSSGSPDTAQDPDVIYHEVLHAIHDDQVPGWGTTQEGKAIGEGTADYWAAALTDDTSVPSLGVACVAAWWATGFTSGCLRRVDGTGRYPADLVFREHDDGWIYSSALWALRQSLGGGVVDRLVIKSHTFLDTAATFVDGADALLAADQALYGGSHTAAIHAAMASRGIPRTGNAASPDDFPVSAPFSCETAHPYANLDYTECRYSKPGATRIRVHFAAFDTEEGYDYVRVSDNDYREVDVLSGSPFGESGGGYSAAVPGGTIVVRFKADNFVTANGFAIDRFEYEYCTRKVGYWKNAPTDPAWAALGGAGTPFFVSGSTYGAVIATTGGKNPYYVMARQYIAAELNRLSGASLGAQAATFARTATILGQYTPKQIEALQKSSPLRAEVLQLSNVLEMFNDGTTGPGGCA